MYLVIRIKSNLKNILITKREREKWKACRWSKKNKI